MQSSFTLRRCAARPFAISHLVSPGVLRGLITATLVVLIQCPAVTATDRMIRVTDSEQDYVGRIVALTTTTCSLMDRQGKLLKLSVADLTGFERVADRFRPFPDNVFRDELQKEFGGSYEVSGTTHYLVAAPRGRAAEYARLFENIYREVEQFYRVRGFNVQEPDVPMVAVVFGSQREFAGYCQRDGVPPARGLLGYYSLMSNRVALFDDASLLKSVQRKPVGNSGGSPSAADTTIAALANVAGNTAATIIHETTHQVGYNIGIHSRLGGTPVWVIEGLATSLEPDAMRSKSGRNLQTDRLNQERHDWFNSKRSPRRAMGDLAKLIADDKYFHANTLDSYSESWALTFFLLENSSRRKNLAAYLHRLRQRDPLETYTAEQRLSDFQAEFGDISRLEVEFMRFMERL
ncbi:MAG: DUF1570 domain-containing protein [Planctomycetaceae bacterium]